MSNRSSIGAKVRVNAFNRGASRWQVRDVSGGDSENNQQSLNAEFGLADATSIDTLRIEWPSGIVQELRNVAPRQFLTVTEARACADGLDNDADGKIDFDGGRSSGAATPTAPDPSCAGLPSLSEASRGSCGLGFELGLALVLLAALRRRMGRRIGAAD